MRGKGHSLQSLTTGGYAISVRIIIRRYFVAEVWLAGAIPPNALHSPPHRCMDTYPVCTYSAAKEEHPRFGQVYEMRLNLMPYCKNFSTQCPTWLMETGPTDPWLRLAIQVCISS